MKPITGTVSLTADPKDFGLPVINPPKTAEPAQEAIQPVSVQLRRSERLALRHVAHRAGMTPRDWARQAVIAALVAVAEKETE